MKRIEEFVMEGLNETTGADQPELSRHVAELEE
jgi:hypothetical protein